MINKDHNQAQQKTLLLFNNKMKEFPQLLKRKLKKYRVNLLNNNRKMDWIKLKNTNWNTLLEVYKKEENS